MNKIYILCIILNLSCSQIHFFSTEVSEVTIMSQQVLGKNSRVFDISIKKNQIIYYGFKNVNPIGRSSLNISTKKTRTLITSLYNDSYEIVKKKRDFNYITISFDKNSRYLKFDSSSLKKLFNLIQEHKL